MNNLTDYILRLPNLIDSGIADETVKYLEDERTIWEEHVFYNNRNGEYSSNGEDCFYSRSILPNHNDLMDKVWDAVNKYVVDTNKSDYFNSWEGFTQVEFHRYHPTSKMLKHCDHIHSIFDGEVKGIPILTVLGVLNDGYTGGEFVMFEDTVIPFGKGDVIVFPSCFLYPHEVRQLMDGVRYSFVSWVF